SSSPSSTTATIANVAPAVTPGPNQSATIGIPVTVSATFSDPGTNDAPWTYTVAWGDGLPATTGSTTSQTNPITATHTYALPGPRHRPTAGRQLPVLDHRDDRECCTLGESRTKPDGHHG